MQAVRINPGDIYVEESLVIGFIPIIDFDRT